MHNSNETTTFYQRFIWVPVEISGNLEITFVCNNRMHFGYGCLSKRKEALTKKAEYIVKDGYVSLNLSTRLACRMLPSDFMK